MGKHLRESLLIIIRYQEQAGAMVPSKRCNHNEVFYVKRFVCSSVPGDEDTRYYLESARYVSQLQMVAKHLKSFDSKFGPWTKSQAGLVSCLKPWKNTPASEASQVVIAQWLSHRTVSP